MPKSRTVDGRAIYATIVSNNAETLDGLQSYFARVGVPSHSTRSIHDLAAVAPAAATATVIFPDDFAEAAVLELLGEIRRKRPRLLTLLVTRTPQRLRTALGKHGHSPALIVLPRPSFGWDILDVIRGRTPNIQV